VSPDTIDRTYALLAASLPAWRVAGQVERAVDGAILITAGDTRMRVTPAPPELPFRWMVAIGERTRGATSISGLLRAVRAAIDPSYGPLRLRIAAPAIERP
jgi:hypothetical protein